MRFRRRVGEFEVVAACAPDLELEATALLDKIAVVNERGPAIHDGTTIQFGWSLLTLVGPSRELEVWEPDFSGDPIHDMLPQVENTLTVAAEQVALLRSSRLGGTDAGYRQRVVIAKGCLEAERIYLERKEPKQPSDSGWYIGPVDNPETAAQGLEVLFVYHIFQRRRALMQALALPYGCLVIFQGQILEAVFDKNGNRLDHIGRPVSHHE